MNKQQVIERLEDRWADFHQSFQDLSESQMTRPGPVGGWSIKDILAHVRAWEEEALKAFPLILENKRLPRYKDLYGGINAFNAMTCETNRDLPLKTVLSNLEDTHKRLMAYLRSLPEEQFGSGTRFRRRLAADTFNHYPEHTETIKR